MRVTVVIPVKEINEYIMESMVHLRRLEYEDFEVFILPDRDTGVRLAGARVLPTGPVGPAEKRDLAAMHSSGEILAFLDDDAYPAPDWLSKAVRHFHAPEVAAVGGPAVTPESDSTMQKASGAVFASRLTSSSYVYRYLPRRGRDVDDFPTVNLFVRRSVFEEVGGFDTDYWPGEDTKLCLDIVSRGLRIVYDPEVMAWHHRRALFAPHLRQVSRYAFQRGVFVRAFPETSMRPGYFVPSAFVLFLLLGPALSAVHPGFFIFWATVVCVYAAAVGAAAVGAAAFWRSPAVGLATGPGIALTHLVYGVNFLRGLLARRSAPAGVRVETT